MKKVKKVFGEILNGNIKIEVENREEYDQVILLMELFTGIKLFDQAYYWKESSSIFMYRARIDFVSGTISRQHKLKVDSPYSHVRTITLDQFKKMILLINGKKKSDRLIRLLCQSPGISERRLITALLLKDFE